MPINENQQTTPEEVIGGDFLLSMIGDLEFLVAYEQRQRAAHFHSRSETFRPPPQEHEYRKRLGRLVSLMSDHQFLVVVLHELHEFQRPDLQDYLRGLFAYRHEPSLEARNLTHQDLVLKKHITGKYKAAPITAEQPYTVTDELANVLAQSDKRAAEAEHRLAEMTLELTRLKKHLASASGASQLALKTGHLASAMVAVFANYLNDRLNMHSSSRAKGGPRFEGLAVGFSELEAPLHQMARKLKEIEREVGKPCGHAEVAELINTMFKH